MPPSITWKGTRGDLVRSLHLIPAVLAGTHADRLGLHDIFWGYVGNAVLDLIQRNFKDKMQGGGGYDNIPWQELAKMTLKLKRPVAPYTKFDILAETGALYDSLEPGSHEVPSGAVNQVFDFLPAGVRVGSKDPKADAHQEGREDTNLPARPFVPEDLPDKWLPNIEFAMEEGIQAVIERMVANGGIL